MTAGADVAPALDHRGLTYTDRASLVATADDATHQLTVTRNGTVEKTIKVHRARVMEKLGADSLAYLVHFAGKLGIRSPEI